MKNLNIFVNEQKSFKAFRINQDHKPSFQQYDIKPADRKELQDILEERISKDPNADLNDIDVSNVTDMNHLFLRGSSGWFRRLDPHDIDISDWDVSKVEDMGSMFYDCPNFTGRGLENWNVSNVKDMRDMFYKCKKLKCDISNWDISENCIIKDMFSAIKNRQNIKLPDCLYDPKKNTHKSNGEELMWFKVWKILDENGPMTKAEVLTSMGLKPTSYATSFALWSSCNMIVGDKGKLKALPSNEWTKEIF